MEREQQTLEIERQFIRGEVIFTIYENEADLFAIVRVKIHETNENYEEAEIIMQGHFAGLQAGVLYEFFGELYDHPNFGLQYKVSSYETYIPKTGDGLIHYLSSDLFPGVGQRTAKAIVNMLGDDAIEQIIDQPNALFKIPHMRKKTAEMLIDTLKTNQGFERVAVKLTSYGLSLKMAQQLFAIYKDKTLQLIQENPYTFVLEVEGFGFPTADKIAQYNEIDLAHPHRIQAGCIYALQMGVLDGHVYLPENECIKRMRHILKTSKLSDDEFREHIVKLADEEHIVIHDEQIYLPSLYYAEDHFSNHVKRILEIENGIQITDAELMSMIGKTEEEEAISYGLEQFNAIKEAIHSKILILTGGPGTGKTTVIKAIIKAYADIHQLSTDMADYKKKSQFPFILTAPTGRAAKRLQQSTGMRASTIHSLLGWDGHDIFEKNEYEKLSGKYIIIDEFSMVDTWLANHLFKAIPDDMQVLIVGDEDQLPSVGPGQVLADLLKTRCIPYVQLTEVYRQKDGSKIIDLAHLIKQDNCSINNIKNDSDFSFIHCHEKQILEAVTTVIERAINKGIEVKDIQVLAPMYKTTVGINKLNKEIQQLVNPKGRKKREVFFNDVIYRVGDRVIQLVNQPEDHVYNGDIGEIVQIFRPSENDENEEQIVVQYDETDVIYTRSNYINMSHAYCISIHKSQGSEFPIVILPVVNAYRRMLRKNLLYTAVTRGKRSLIICGDIDAFMRGIQTTNTDQRYTSLQTQLQSKLQKLDNKHLDNNQVTNNEQLIMADEEQTKADEEITPFDFM